MRRRASSSAVYMDLTVAQSHPTAVNGSGQPAQLYKSRTCFALKIGFMLNRERLGDGADYLNAVPGTKFRWRINTRMQNVACLSCAPSSSDHVSNVGHYSEVDEIVAVWILQTHRRSG